MVVFIGKRLLQLIPVLFGVLLVTFAVTRLTPGDPADLLAGEDATQAMIEATRVRLGLDRPVPVQFGIYVLNALQGDLGTSYVLSIPVTQLIGRALYFTGQIAGVALLITIVFGVPLGVLSAVRRDTLLDGVARVISLIGVSIPNFFFGLLSILLFSLTLGWLPSFVSPAEVAEGIVVINETAAEHDREIDPEHMGALVSYMNDGDEIPAELGAFIKSRRPDLEPTDVIVQGKAHLAERLEQFVEAGASKFVLIAFGEPADWTEELEEVAAITKPLEN